MKTRLQTEWRKLKEKMIDDILNGVHVELPHCDCCQKENCENEGIHSERLGISTRKDEQVDSLQSQVPPPPVLDYEFWNECEMKCVPEKGDGK